VTAASRRVLSFSVSPPEAMRRTSQPWPSQSQSSSSQSSTKNGRHGPSKLSKVSTLSQSPPRKKLKPLTSVRSHSGFRHSDAQPLARSFRTHRRMVSFATTTYSLAKAKAKRKLLHRVLYMVRFSSGFWNSTLSDTSADSRLWVEQYAPDEAVRPSNISTSNCC
jgi:hypothetical protein